MSTNVAAGLIAAVISYIVIGIGVGAGGTNLLALLAKQVAPQRRAPAVTIVWLMMFVGFIIASATAGAFLDTGEGAPYDPARLVLVTAIVCGVAFTASALAVWGVERRPAPAHRAAPGQSTPEAPSHGPGADGKPAFLETLADVWREGEARRFAIFVFVSMFAYNMQDLILEPYAGAAFGFSVGESTSLTGMQHSGALAGMIVVGILAGKIGGGRPAALKLWTVAGCIASALALGGLALSGQFVDWWPFQANVILMGFTTGAFTVAAISSMMGLAGAGKSNREGIRMGVWGAAQAIAFALGSFVGTMVADASHLVLDMKADAYGIVFLTEAVLFLISAALAARIGGVAAVHDAQADRATSGRLASVAENQLGA
jgi:BCD family chlorophyll transporter-like MFS transporter